MDIPAEDRKRISAAIRAAEARTSGEIVCVLAESSYDGKALAILLAAAIALALPWLLVALTALTVHRILLLQLAVFVVAAAVLCLPRVRVALAPRRLLRAAAHQAAMHQFLIRGIARTKDRSGILIFVSLAEHYARIVADDGIAARVAQSDWQAAVDALVAHMRDGRIADGFIASVELCTAPLATHFPRSTADRDELPDRIYVI
jgi:putative membrane protein